MQPWVQAETRHCRVSWLVSSRQPHRVASGRNSRALLKIAAKRLKRSLIAVRENLDEARRSDRLPGCQKESAADHSDIPLIEIILRIVQHRKRSREGVGGALKHVLGSV